MKVIYYDNIVEKLDKAIEEAKLKGKKIKLIKLSAEEFEEFEKLINFMTYGYSYSLGLDLAEYKNVTIVKYEKQ